MNDMKMGWDAHARLVIDTLTHLCDEFAVGLHITLLEVIGKFVKVLVIRE